MVVLNLPFFIARRYFIRQKGGFSAFIIRLSIIATALSVAVMILAVAFMNGFKYEVRQKLFSFWGHVLITNYSVNASSLITTEPVRYDTDLVHRLQGIKQVKQIAPFIVRAGILQYNGAMEGIKLKGVNTSFHFPPKMEISGSNIDFHDADYSKDIILSRTTANRLKVKVGDELQLYFIEQGSAPRIRKMKIKGLYHTGMEEVDKDYALCDIRLLQRINNWQPNEINGYQLDLDDAKYMDTTASLIFEQYIDAPLYAYTMHDVYGNIFDWLRLLDKNAQIALIIMAIVAVINMIATIIILIVEQTKLVGLLKAMGMRLNMMMGIFLYYAGIIAGVGIVVGNFLALGICFLQQRFGFLKMNEATYYMSQVPVRIEWWQIVMIDIVTLFLCILCMSLPSLYIRRIHPARVLQFK